MADKKDTGAGEAKQARAEEAARQAKIRSGTEAISSLFDRNFNDDFFAKRRQAYVDYALPQVDEQYGDAQRQLAFALSRAGLGNSSVRGSEAGRLQKKYDLTKQEVVDRGLTEEGQARGSIEDARSNLIAMLNATGDSDAAISGATARISSLSAPPAYSPLSNLFAEATTALGQQAALERANYYSGGAVTPPRYGTGLFTPSNRSVLVRGG